MARISEQQPLQASVLDRLIHVEQRSSLMGGGRGSGVSLRDLKQSIRRDLENLLNTRWRCSAWPPNLDELEQSLVNYGIPDFSGSSLGSAANRQEFRRIIERAIERFETRLSNINVELVDNNEPLDRTLRFRINAMLRAAPSPEAIVFDSALEPLTASFEVKGGNR